MNKTLHLMAAVALAGTISTACGGSNEGATQQTTIAAPTDTGSAPGDPCGFTDFISGFETVFVNVFDPEVTPAERKAQFSSYVSQIEQWAKVMPTEIAADFELVVAGARSMDKVLAAHSYDLQALTDDSTGMAALQELMAVADTEEGQQSGDRLDAWFLDNCGVDLNADDTGDTGGSESDPLAGARLPFDPCTVPSVVDLTELVDVDFTDGSTLGTFSGDAAVQVSCGWRSDDFSLLSIASIAFTDPDAAARDIRSSISAFGGEVESLDDRFPAPAFATVFDTLVTVYVLGTDAPFGVSFTRTVPDGDPVPDLETTYAIAEALVIGLEPVPGGLDLPTDDSTSEIPIDAEPFDSENAVYPFDACEAATSAAVTALVDTGGMTTSSGGGSGTYQTTEMCSASGTTGDGTEVEVTMVAVAFDDSTAARADIINGSDGETSIDLAGLPDGSFATTDDFWGDTVWVLDTETPFGVRVVVADSDPKGSDLALAAEVALAFLAQ